MEREGVVAAGDLLLAVPQLTELDLNPVLITADVGQ